MGEGHVGTRDTKASVAVEAGDGMLSADLVVRAQVLCCGRRVLCNLPLL